MIIYIYIYDCCFLFLSLAPQEIISFAGFFTVSSRRTAGFYPYPFLTSYPFLPLGKKGALISSGAGPRVGEWDLGPGPELARSGGKCFTESSRELHGKGVNTSAVNPVLFLYLV